MHAWFECIEWLRDDEIPNEAMLRERAETLTVARETIDQLLPEFLMLVEQSDLRCAFDRATGGRSSAFAAHADVLRSAQCELHVERERPFVRIVEGQLVTGTIDRLVRLVLHGRTIAADIVDFKTDRLVGDTSRWIREKQEHYGPQLREYGDAVAAMYSIDPGQISRRLLLLEARTIASV